MTEDASLKHGMVWWSKLLPHEKDAVIEPLMREGKSNKQIMEALGLASLNMVAGPRHRINHRDPTYKPPERKKKLKQEPLPIEQQAEALRVVPTPPPAAAITLAPVPALFEPEPALPEPLLPPRLNVIRNPEYKREHERREDKSTELVIRNISAIKRGTWNPEPSKRPFARLDRETQKIVRQHARRIINRLAEWH